MCIIGIDTDFEANRNGARAVAGALKYFDALGNERCGITGILTTACECFSVLEIGLFPRAGYRGNPVWDEDTDTYSIPSGQAPLALTSGH